MKITCNIIQDLIPLYMDKISSCDTNAAVEEHIQNCDICKNIIKKIEHDMQSETDLTGNISEKKVFEKVRKVSRLKIIIASVISVVITLIFAFSVQEIGILNDLFNPRQMIAFTLNDENVSETIEFSMDTVFYKKRIINDANSTTMSFSVYNDSGSKIYDKILLSPGETFYITDLKIGQNYKLEINGEEGQYFVYIR